MADALDTEVARFLTDVSTAAGLLYYGKRDKKLAERISGRLITIMGSLASGDLSWLREEGEREGEYNATAATRAEVLRELLEWEAHYIQQARGGDQSGRSDARADAAREIHDHLSSSWDARSKVSAHWSDCATSNGPAYPVGPCDCGAVPAENLAQAMSPKMLRPGYMTDTERMEATHRLRGE